MNTYTLGKLDSYCEYVQREQRKQSSFNLHPTTQFVKGFFGAVQSMLPYFRENKNRCWGIGCEFKEGSDVFHVVEGDDDSIEFYVNRKKVYEIDMHDLDILFTHHFNISCTGLPDSWKHLRFIEEFIDTILHPTREQIDKLVA